MRILIYTLNYAPEVTGIGKYTAEQAEWLAARGHDVRVITAPPYYPAWRVGEGYRAWAYRHERIEGVDVYRAPVWVPARPSGAKRLLHLLSFAVASVPALLAQCAWRPDVIFAIEPPLGCTPAALAFSRMTGSRCWLHVQDYEVDAAFALGLLRKPWLHRAATFVERWLMSRCDRVSSISPAMVALARAKGVAAERTQLVPNWASLQVIESASGDAVRRELELPPDAVVALYSGNMGAKQGLEILAESARHLEADPDMGNLHFIFCGDGAGRAALEQACAGLQRVRFLPLQSAARFPSLLAAADIHLLPQHAGASDLVMPSKLTGMLASGRPVVATAPADSSLGEVVRHCGLLSPPGDAGAFADAISTLLRMPAERKAMGAAGQRWARENLDRDMVLGRLEASLLALCGQGETGHAAGHISGGAPGHGAGQPATATERATPHATDPG